MRQRDTSRWGVGKIYPSPNYFTENEIADGLHTIQVGSQLLDILIRDRKSPVTVVTFQHRVSTRSTYPTLVGEGFTGKAGVNLIAVADPSIALDSKVRLGWYLGNRAIGKLRSILLPLIDTAVAALGTQRLIFFGNSGGGYAALDYAAANAGSIAVTVNPRLGFNAGNDEDFGVYMSGCHPRLGRTAYARVTREYAIDLKDSIPRGAGFYAAMYHNIGDQEYYQAHHQPFVEARKDDLQIAERFENDGDGHVPIPKNTLHEIFNALSDLSRPMPEALINAGFQTP